MKKNFQTRILLSSTLLLLVAIGLLTWGNWQYAKTSPGGNDFLVHWMGTRNFLTEGISPYSDETALDIQTMVYGRAAQAGEHELRVAYPLYSMVLFAPFALIQDFTLARAIWMTLLELSLAAIALLSIKLVSRKTPSWLVITMLVFTFFSYHGVRPLINGNAVMVITLLLLGSIYLVANGKDEIAGILLAFSTIKPQNAILIVVFILLWAIIKKRSKIIYWFSGTLVLLVGFSLLLIPDWIMQNFREIIRYTSYNPAGSPGAAMVEAWGDIGMRFSVFLSVLIAAILLAEWFGTRRGGIQRFIWVSMLTLALSQWSGIQTDPGNFILMYPAIIYAFVGLWERWKERSKPIILGVSAVLVVGLWILFAATVQYSYQPVQSSIMFFPLPAIAILLLYWVRWWAIYSREIDLPVQGWKS